MKGSYYCWFIVAWSVLPLVCPAEVTSYFPETTLIELMCSAIEGNPVTNAAPEKTMLRLVPKLDEADFSKVWPFQPQRIEQMFSSCLVKGEDGKYRLKNGAGRLPCDSTGFVTPEASVKYVNRVFLEWAVGELDRSFARVSTNEVKRVLEGTIVEKDKGVDPSLPILSEKGFCSIPGKAREAPWTSMWRIDGDYFVLITPARGDSLARYRFYFILWDGHKDWPVSYFDEFPSPRRAWSILKILTLPAACNDIAVFLDWGQANRTFHDNEYIMVMVREALMRGEETAAWNLGVLLQRKGEQDVSKLMMSRGSKVFAE